jgi:hypothetical protein
MYAAFTDDEALVRNDMETEKKLRDSLGDKGFAAPEIDEDEVRGLLESGKTAREAAEELMENLSGGVQPALPVNEANAEAAAERTETKADADSGQKPTRPPAETAAGSEAEPAQSGGLPEPADNPNDKSKEELNYELDLRIAELYVLEASYSSKIEEIIDEARGEYLALEKEEQTKANKYKIIFGKIDELTSLEEECDERVEALVGEIKSLLAEAGMDTGLSRDIMEYYQNKKKEQKAFYLKSI